MNFYSTFYQLLPLLSFVFTVFLISLVIRSDWKSWRNRVFALLLVAMGLWGLTVFGMRSSPHPEGAAEALLWEKAVIISVLAASVLFYHFTVLYTRSRIPRTLLPSLYMLWASFALLIVFGGVISRMEEVEIYGGVVGWAARFTPLGLVYLAVGYLPTVMGIMVLLRAYRGTRSPEERNRALYVMVGASLSLLGATSDFLSASGVLFYPFGIMANLYFVALTTVAVLRHRLLELRMVLRSGVIYTLLGIFIVGIYGGVMALFNFAFRSQGDADRLVSSISAAAVVAIALQPALGRLQQWVDRCFYRERYDHLQALEEFSQETKDITDLKSISESLTALTRRAMMSNCASLLLLSPQTGEFHLSSTSGLATVDGISLRADSPIVEWLKDHDGALTRDDLEEAPQFEALSDGDRQAVGTLGAEILIPIEAKGRLTGVLVLGPKLAEDSYSSLDTDLLRAVVNQTAMAIENARLYAQEAERLAELEQLEQLKQTLLLTVSHELKTPLTAIKAGAEMLELQEEDSSSSARGRLFRSINRGVERLERLVDESLDYARMQDTNLKLDLQPTDLRELYEDTAGVLAAAVRAKRQGLAVEVPEGMPPVLVDRRRCERILLNLVSNANKYTQQGGSIRVCVEPGPTYMITSVSDTGPGIPQEDLDKVFDVYYKSSSPDSQGAGRSSGLGLAIARYLVELHGGRIWVDSKVGEGTSFKFTLPLGDRNESSGY